MFRMIILGNNFKHEVIYKIIKNKSYVSINILIKLTAAFLAGGHKICCYWLYYII